MRTIFFEKDINIKSNFVDLKDLFSYIIENQLVTEIWYLNENDLSEKSKNLFLKSIKSSNLINI